MLTEESFAEIAARFDFERWKGSNALGRGLTIHNYRIPLPKAGWELVRAWTTPETKAAPPGLQTLWRQAATLDALLRVDVYECASREAAHHQMLQLLGEQQLPNLTFVEEGNLGDVHAASANGEITVFARGNLVIFVARAGKQPAAAQPVAAELDADIVAEPDPKTALPAKGKRARSRGAKPAGPTMVKVFSDSTADPAAMTKAARGPGETVYEVPADDGPSLESVSRMEAKESE